MVHISAKIHHDKPTWDCLNLIKEFVPNLLKDVIHGRASRLCGIVCCSGESRARGHRHGAWWVRSPQTCGLRTHHGFWFLFKEVPLHDLQLGTQCSCKRTHTHNSLFKDRKMTRNRCDRKTLEEKQSPWSNLVAWYTDTSNNVQMGDTHINQLHNITENLQSDSSINNSKNAENNICDIYVSHVTAVHSVKGSFLNNQMWSLYINNMQQQ